MFSCIANNEVTIQGKYIDSYLLYSHSTTMERLSTWLAFQTSMQNDHLRGKKEKILNPTLISRFMYPNVIK